MIRPAFRSAIKAQTTGTLLPSSRPSNVTKRLLTARTTDSSCVSEPPPRGSRIPTRKFSPSSNTWAGEEKSTRFTCATSAAACTSSTRFFPPKECWLSSPSCACCATPNSPERFVPTTFRVIRMTRHVVGTNRSGELGVAQHAHDGEESQHSFGGKNLVELVQAAADVAHVNLVDFSSPAQVLDDGENFLVGILEPLGGGSETQLESVVRAVNNRFVTLDGLEDGRRVPVVCALIAERKAGRIIRVTGHFHVAL